MITHIIHPDGLYLGMDAKEYHADPALGASGVCDLLVSAETYWRKSPHNPDREDEASEAQKLGAHFHALMAGEDDFAVKPEGMSFATKEGKAWRDEHEGRTIVPEALNVKAKRMIKALRDAVAMARIDNGLPEVSFFWTKDGMRRKIRIDMLCGAEAFDYKTFSNAQGKDEETILAHTIAYNRYTVKGLWYQEGLDELCRWLKKNGAAKVKCPAILPAQSLAILEAAAAQDTALPLWFVFIESCEAPMIEVRRFAKYGADGQINGYWRHANNEISRALAVYKKFEDAGVKGFDRPPRREVHFKALDDLDLQAARFIIEEV
jgi:PDDEXK-like domain of unknown function (DUF3799)